MEYYQVSYKSRVVIYDHRAFIRLTTNHSIWPIDSQSAHRSHVHLSNFRSAQRINGLSLNWTTLPRVSSKRKPETGIFFGRAESPMRETAMPCSARARLPSSWEIGSWSQVWTYFKIALMTHTYDCFFVYSTQVCNTIDPSYLFKNVLFPFLWFSNFHKQHKFTNN